MNKPPKQLFNGPIPGQSLTTPPKNFPYERPPQLVSPEEVMSAYAEKFENPKLMDDILTMLDIGGATISELTKGLIRTAVSKGVHTIDAGLLVAPWLHETIRDAADQAGVDYDEGLVDQEKEAELEKAKVSAYAIKQMEKGEMPAEKPKADEVVIVKGPEKPKKSLMERRKS